MSNEEILSELRVIRTLLALDKKEQLEEMYSNLNNLEKRIIEELEFGKWSSLPTSDIADDFDVSNRTVQNRIKDLIDEAIIERRGAARGAEYRKTGLVQAIEIIGGDL